MKDLKFEFDKGLVVKNGAPIIVSGNEVYMQNIKIEAVTTEGDLWHNSEYGWSLIDFMHRSLDELLEIEIYQRIKEKLSKYGYIDVNSVQIQLEPREHGMSIKVSFIIQDEEQEFEIALNRIKAEVMLVG